MSNTTIFGNMTENDNQRGFLQTAGQDVVYNAVREYVARQNMELQSQMSLFVDGTTEDHTQRFVLPGSGYLQERGQQSPLASRKSVGQWDVAFPLKDFGDDIAMDFVVEAYTSATDLQRQIDGIITRNAGTVRHEILRRLFNNTAINFIDPYNGTLVVQPLANGDAVLYPPVLGTVDAATDDHYLESGYAAANITNTNNPFPVIHDELVEHFGQNTGGENIIVFINKAQRTLVRALADFTDQPYRFVTPGDDTAVPNGVPQMPSTAVLIGYGYGVWIAEWPWIPAGYMLGLHLDAPAPLRMRVDPSDTGLARGLALVSQDDRFPVSRSSWVHRFGIGTANRLNGVIMEFGTGGTYTIPSIYA